MTEADFQTRFNTWLRTSGETGAYELKICKSERLPFSAVKAHQESALAAAKHGIFAYKISDYGGTRSGKKPFDCFALNRTRAYVVVMFYRKGASRVYRIDIDVFLREKYASGEKSLHVLRAAELGDAIELSTAQARIRYTE